VIFTADTSLSENVQSFFYSLPTMRIPDESTEQFIHAFLGAFLAEPNHWVGGFFPSQFTLNLGHRF